MRTASHGCCARRLVARQGTSQLYMAGLQTPGNHGSGSSALRPRLCTPLTSSKHRLMTYVMFCADSLSPTGASHSSCPAAFRVRHECAWTMAFWLRTARAHAEPRGLRRPCSDGPSSCEIHALRGCLGYGRIARHVTLGVTQQPDHGAVCHCGCMGTHVWTTNARRRCVRFFGIALRR